VALVGEAYVIVKAITSGVENDIKNAFKDADKVGKDAGTKVMSGFKSSMSSGGSNNSFFGAALDKDIDTLIKKGHIARQVFNDLVIAQNFKGTGAAMAATSISSLVGGVISLGSTLAAAVPEIVAIGGAFGSIGLGAASAILAISGVGAAVGKVIQQQQGQGGISGLISAQRAVDDAKRSETLGLQSISDQFISSDKQIAAASRGVTQAQYDLNKALREGANQLQAIKFAAEDAALGEKRAALNLENARLNLMRVQDLPPNSKARREAELAYQEADLALRKSVDANQQAQAEKNRIIKTGTAADVANLDSVKSAQLAADDAQRGADQAAYDRKLLIRDSTQKQLELELALTRAIEDQKRAQAAANPFLGLTDAQKQFAEFLASLYPVLQALKEIAAVNLFPGVETAINNLVKNFLPTLKIGIAEVSSAMGYVAIQISKGLTSPQTLKDIATIFDTAAYSIRKFGDAIKPIIEAIAAILATAAPQIKDFADSVAKAATDFKNFIDTKRASGELAKFFKTAEDIASQWATIIGNAFGGLFNIIKANTGPGSGGQILLDYFTQITANFKAFSGSLAGQNTLKEYFAGAAKNATAILSAVGKFAEVLLKAGADPGIKQFWDTIGTAAPIFGQIVTQFGNAGPALGNLVVSMLKFVQLVTQGGNITTFFDGLTLAINTVNKILSNPIVQTGLSVLGAMHAVSLVLIVSMRALDFIFFSWFGHLRAAWDMGKKMVTVIKEMGVFAKTLIPMITSLGETVALKFMYAKDAVVEFALNMGAKLKAGIMAAKEAMVQLAEKGIAMVVSGFNALKVVMMENPLILVGVIIAALVVAFIELYKHNERFREIVKAVWGEIQKVIDAAWNGVIKPIFEAIKAVGMAIWDGIKTGLDIVWAAVKLIWDALVLYVKTYIEVIKFEISVVWDVLKIALQVVWDAVKLIWNAIVAGVKAYINAVVSVGSTLWNWLSTGLSAAWNLAVGVWNTIISFVSGLGAKIANAASGMWNGLKSGLSSVINFIIGGLNWVIGALNKISFTFPDWVPLLGGKHFGLSIPPIPPVQLAAGGVVMPRAGGTLATIAEAGRPERVEPLDPDGLSKRDKALIDHLTNAKGGLNGAVFNIHPSPGMSEVELAHLVSRQIAFQTRRGSI
jgi:phage-related protein